MEKFLLSFLRDSWEKCLPYLTDDELLVLKYYVENFPNRYTAYTISKVLKLNISTSYKIVKMLYENRLILPDPDRRYRATVKGALTLLVKKSDLKYLEIVKKIWRVNSSSISLLAYLIILGEAISFYKFKIDEAFICSLTGSLGYVISFISEGGLKHILPYIVNEAFEFLKLAPMSNVLNFEILQKLCLNDERCVKYGICYTLS
ncbi:hypothetical protein Pogu_0997 [Pyrobaculum oguniense TE7]|uniref:Uncharacterized protein n=1 Tax=Pyrobaculum oguniense (strain DSM 13380 / JCM 10595 / TE7) TaxID=698757 RepID=H6Q9W6_PYROT|nr:hypothetical protein Pogu_0997 [Pyrobaculum oguniense TE7]